MNADLPSSLKQYFGFTEFRPGQQSVIEHLLAGRSAAAVFPTGSGKSLCYQLPALLLPGVTLVVSPLIALMKDQIDALALRGIAAARLDSTLSADDYRAVMQQVRGGELRLLYVAPERFQNERFRQAVSQIRVSLFAVDEAHCISEWGHAFRPDYLKLVEFARQCKAERVLALTATATPQVLGDICTAFAIKPEYAVRTGFYRPNLTLQSTPVSIAERDKLLIERMQFRAAGPTIVYVTLQKTAEQVAERLCQAGFHARPYHAGMENDVRANAQEWFLQSRSGIVVATIAFGMGVDKPDIRYVYHYNMSKSLESYSQEIGRSGRDGQPAICETLLCMDDLCALENFAYGDTPTLDCVQSLVDDIFAQTPHFDVSYYELSGKHDIRILVVRTLMTYLELDGYLKGGTPFYSTYKFKPLKSSQEILGQFSGERREFLAGVLRNAKKAKTWFSIDVDQTAAALNVPRDRIVRALDYLGEQGFLELQAAGTRNQYQRLKAPADLAALATDLHGRMVAREKREIARLGQMLELLQLDRCQVLALCEHFGETLDKSCGHCSWCLKKNAPSHQNAQAAAEPRTAKALDAKIVAQAIDLRRQHPQELRDATQLARLLCGVASPALTKAKLTSHPLSGALSDVSFQVVREHFAHS